MFDKGASIFNKFTIGIHLTGSSVAVEVEVAVSGAVVAIVAIVVVAVVVVAATITIKVHRFQGYGVVVQYSVNL